MEPTIHKMKVSRWTPWQQYNEYEGQVEGIVQEHPVCCYFLSHAGEWDRPTGVSLALRLWIERSGAVSVLAPPIAPKLEQLDGVYYRAVGRVCQVEDERLLLASLVMLEVDLDLGPCRGAQVPPLCDGDWISVVGRLQAEIPE